MEYKIKNKDLKQIFEDYEAIPSNSIEELIKYYKIEELETEIYCESCEAIFRANNSLNIRFCPYCGRTNIVFSNEK